MPHPLVTPSLHDTLPLLAQTPPGRASLSLHGSVRVWVGGLTASLVLFSVELLAQEQGTGASDSAREDRPWR
jgi:hypothetical protein